MIGTNQTTQDVSNPIFHGDLDTYHHMWFVQEANQPLGHEVVVHWVVRSAHETQSSQNIQVAEGMEGKALHST